MSPTFFETLRRIHATRRQRQARAAFTRMRSAQMELEDLGYVIDELYLPLDLISDFPQDDEEEGESVV